MNKNKRLKELNDFVGNDKVIFLRNLIDDIVFMEEQLERLKKQPFVMTNVANPSNTKRTESSKLYLSLMAQYTQDIKALSYLAGKSGEEEEISPLRLYMQSISK